MTIALCWVAAASSFKALLDMREFIYISDRKLAQFMPDAPPAWWRRKLARAEVKTPLGTLGIDAADASADEARVRKLYQTIRHLETHARWYEEPDLEVGEWVFFEAKLVCQVIDMNNVFRSRSGGGEVHPAAVIFVSLDDPVDLMLHGSAEHLLGHQAAMNTERFMVSPSSSAWLLRFLRTLDSRERTLGPRSTSDAIDLPSKPSWESEASSYASLIRSTRDLMFRTIPEHSGPVQSTAAKLAGYARVTLQPKSMWKTVVATPLFVEYARDC